MMLQTLNQNFKTVVQKHGPRSLASGSITALASQLARLMTGAAFLLTAACAKHEVPITQHEGPVVGDEVVHAPTTAPMNIDALKKVDAPGISARVGQNSPQQTISALETLSPFILNAAYIENPRLVQTKQVREALRAFNDSLLSLHRKNPEQALNWIEKERVMIESGCDGELKGCVNLGFFRQENSSSKIMVLAAMQIDREIEQSPKGEKRDQLLRLYYRRLAVAFELVNRTADSELEFMYLSRAAELAESFPKTAADSRERQLIAQHSEVFEMILNRFSPDLSNPEMRARFERFVTAFRPWKYSRREANPFGQAATRMLSLAAQNFLYQDTSKKALNSSLIAAISDAQKTTSPVSGDALNEGLETSFAMVSQSLKTSEMSLWKNLSLNDEFSRDEYFFMVDRLFGDHLTPDDASEIWRGSNRNAQQLLTVAEKYMKIQIAAQIVRTNRYMSSIYANKDWSSATLFTKAVEKSYPVSTQWNQLLSRIERLQLFIDRNLKALDNSQSSQELRDVNRMLTSMRRNIKYLSVYPNMMLMVYFMAEVDFKLEVYTYFGKYDIDSGVIISWFFDGKIKPLFNFGNDADGLKRIETLYAFLFALKTETFKAFSVNQKPLDISKFFEVVIGKFMDADRVELQNGLESIRKDVRQSNTLDLFTKTCQADRASLDSSGKLGTRGTPIATDLSTFQRGAYQGANSGLGEDAHRFYRGDLASTVRTINEGLRAKLTFVHVLIEILDQHLQASGANDTTRRQTVAGIEKHLSTIERLQAEYLTEVIRANDVIGPCLEQSVAIEIEQQSAAFALEAQHLRGVWEAMRAARAGGAQALTKANAELRATLGLSDISKGANYPMVSQISKNEYVYGELDVLLRFRQHMKKVSPALRIVMPSDLTDTSYWKSRNQVVIPFDEDVRVFVRQGMRNFGASGAAFVNWINTTSNPESFINRLKLETELYKLGEIQVYNIREQSCANANNVQACPMIKTEISADRVVEDTARTIQLLSMSDANRTAKTDVETITWLGGNSRWDKSQLRGFLLDQNGDPTTLFEGIYRVITDDQAQVEEAREFHMTEKSVGHFLFAPEERFKTVLRKGFAPRVQQYFKRINQFEAAVERREQKDAASGQILDFSYEILHGDLRRSPIDMSSGRPVYLSRPRMDDQRTRHEIFNRETNGIFNSSN